MIDCSAVIGLIGNLAILAAGVRILAMSGEAPRRESMPLVVTKCDLERHNGGLRVRQVLLLIGGILLMIVAVWRLAR